jgi:hypothetical protein
MTLWIEYVDGRIFKVCEEYADAKSEGYISLNMNFIPISLMKYFI